MSLASFLGSSQLSAAYSTSDKKLGRGLATRLHCLTFSVSSLQLPQFDNLVVGGRGKVTPIRRETAVGHIPVWETCSSCSERTHSCFPQRRVSKCPGVISFDVVIVLH